MWLNFQSFAVREGTKLFVPSQDQLLFQHKHCLRLYDRKKKDQREKIKENILRAISYFDNFKHLL